MKRILIIGAGRSSGVLIEYLAAKAESKHWNIRLGDYNFSLAELHAQKSSLITPFKVDISDHEQVYKEVNDADIIVSMVPANMHYSIAKICVDLKKSMVTASYVSPEIMALNDKAIANQCLILMECGLDPGLDHMSAMKVIDDVKTKGGKLKLFKSYTGGLIAPESDNLWNYKFTWNPRNVVLAGQGVSKFIRNSKFKYVPYHQLFRRIDTLNIDGFGMFEAYPNRDSLKYDKLYKLNDIPTLIRGTLRKQGFCEFWNVFVQLGMTDDSYYINETVGLTYREFLNSFLSFSTEKTVEEKFQSFFNLDSNNSIYKKIEALGLFDDTIVSQVDKVTPAMVLLEILSEKWFLSEEDKDMVVMQHQFEYTLDSEDKKIESSLVMVGENNKKTAMAKGVGLPVGVAVENILNAEIKSIGVHIPVDKSIYQPILDAVELEGIVFKEVSK